MEQDNFIQHLFPRLSRTQSETTWATQTKRRQSIPHGKHAECWLRQALTHTFAKCRKIIQQQYIRAQPLSFDIQPFVTSVYIGWCGRGRGNIFRMTTQIIYTCSRSPDPLYRHNSITSLNIPASQNLIWAETALPPSQKHSGLNIGNHRKTAPIQAIGRASSMHSVNDPAKRRTCSTSSKNMRLWVGLPGFDSSLGVSTRGFHIFLMHKHWQLRRKNRQIHFWFILPRLFLGLSACSPVLLTPVITWD